MRQYNGCIANMMDKEWVIFYMKSRAHYTIATYTNTIVHTSAMMGMERRNEFFPAL